MNMGFLKQVMDHPDVPIEKKVREIKEAIEIRKKELIVLGKWLDRLGE